MADLLSLVIVVICLFLVVSGLYVLMVFICALVHGVFGIELAKFSGSESDSSLSSSVSSSSSRSNKPKCSQHGCELLGRPVHRRGPFNPQGEGFYETITETEYFCPKCEAEIKRVGIEHDYLLMVRAGEERQLYLSQLRSVKCPRCQDEYTYHPNEDSFCPKCGRK